VKKSDINYAYYTLLGFRYLGSRAFWLWPFFGVFFAKKNKGISFIKFAQKNGHFLGNFFGFF